MTKKLNMLFKALSSFLPQNISYDDFVKGSSEKYWNNVFNKGWTDNSNDIKNNSFLAIIGSLVVVFLYILVRFRKWQFSLGAVAAVFHDVLLVLGIFSDIYFYAFQYGN